MKQLFAIFCALVLMPLGTAQAWVGGPFSNNSYFGENGDDGVYEAFASANNALGLFRIVVGNNFAGSQDFVTAPATFLVFDDDGNFLTTITTPGFASGNVVIGAFSTASNVWYFEGVSYSGNTLGTVNSGAGIVVATATASDGNTATINSAFQARIRRQGQSLPITGFNGSGQAQTGTGDRFRFTVFGSKVSSEILFGF